MAETGLQLDAEVLASISDGANGDLRNAVETLQLAVPGVPVNAKATLKSKGKVSSVTQLNC